MPKPIHQRFDTGRVRAMALIFSVTELKVWPGPMTGGLTFSPVLGSTSAAMSLRLGFQGGVRVADRGDVGGPRPGVQLRHQAVVERRVLQLHHPAVRVVDAA